MARTTQGRVWSVAEQLADFARRISWLERRISRKVDIIGSAGSIAARRGGGGNVSIPSGSVTNFDVGSFEFNYGMSSGALAGSIAIPVDGVYMISAGVRWASGWTGVGQVRIMEATTGSLIVDSRSVAVGGSGSQHVMTLATMVELTAGMELNVALFQNSGSAQNTAAGFGLPFLAAALMRRI